MTEVCPFCGANHATKQDVLDHIFARHRGVKYRCPFCRVRGLTDTKLVKHVGTRHRARFNEFFFDIPYRTLREAKIEP